MVVEFLVVLVGNLALRPRPQGRGLVQGLFLLAVKEDDGEGDVVGIGADDGLDPLLLQELLGVLLEMQGDDRAAGGLLARLHGVFAEPVGGPQPAGALAGLAGQDLDLVRHHEGGIEADAELADQAGVLLGVAADLVDEGGRARAGDGAEIVVQLGLGHAHSVIGDGQGVRLVVGGDTDLEGAVVGGQIRVGDRQESQLVAGICGVRDQLSQKHLTFAVKRVRDDVQKF